MNNITFRSIQEEDFGIINRIRNQSTEYLHDDRKFSEESTKNWIKETKPDWYAILLDGEMIGYFRLSNYSRENRNIYIGADIEESHRGKGLGYQSYLSMMSNLFTTRKLNKITLEVLSTNERAYKLYRKLGFSVEGTKRQEVWRNDTWVDSIIMSITRSEFMRTNPGMLGSPCIGICKRDAERCNTCGRSLEQIAAWKGSSQEQLRVYMDDLCPKISNTIE